MRNQNRAKHLTSKWWIAIGFVVSVLFSTGAAGLNPEEILSDPILEARAHEIGSVLRCLVCQNESIEQSEADLARDLRVMVRERLVAGDTDQQVIKFMVDRYGEFVLLQPVFGPHTLLLWIAAPAFLLSGLAGAVIALRRRKLVPPPLTPAEIDALKALDGYDP